MRESNQGPGDEIPRSRGEAPSPDWTPGAPDPVAPPPAGSHVEPDSIAPPAGSHPADPAAPPAESQRAAVLHGLKIWFGVISIIGIAAVLLGQAELVLMVALAGTFIAAQAADRDPSFEWLRVTLSGVFVIGASLTFGMMAVWLAHNASASLAGPLAIGIAAGGAVFCLVTAWRPVADGLVYGFFRTAESGHTLRLGARVVLVILLFAVPGWVAAPLLLEQLNEMHEPLLDTGQMISTVIGLTLLALAAVGFLIRRDLRQTLERLGLARIKPQHVGFVALGVAILYFLNLGSEALQRLWFPGQWAHDQRINELIAGGLTVPGALLLGVTAGVGEELAMRGALQPRLGVFLTSAAFGIVMIFVLGAALGIIRQRTSTTVAILVHSLYDIAAVFAAGGATK
jgi:hypothetical protein